jgi:hypothetical protein
MAHKQVLFRSAAREKILRGATQLADAIRVTLGPRSKSVLIEKKWGAPTVCNDGVTIAKEFDLKDPEENLGAQMLRQAAEKTGELVGDGTGTSTILAHAIRYLDQVDLDAAKVARERYGCLTPWQGDPATYGHAALTGSDLTGVQGLGKPQLERAIGVIYRPETERASHYFQAVLPRQFDEYIWFDDTRAVTPFGTAELAGLPDTHPFGV